nr:hypothetical protein [Cressdnaviricota sp.]
MWNMTIDGVFSLIGVVDILLVTLVGYLAGLRMRKVTVSECIPSACVLLCKGGTHSLMYTIV